MLKRRMRSINKGLFLFGVTLLLLGGFVFSYPQLNEIWTDRKLRREVDIFFSCVQTTPGTTPGESGTEAEENAEFVPEQYPELWEKIRKYNDYLFKTEQEDFSKKNAYVQPSFVLADYGLESEVFAVLSIPKLDLTMPVYLGATARHMADGAAQMTATSLPIGGTNTNCVIAGHRGWNGAPYFLYIPTLEIGDKVTITNLWETLTYTVVETKIISPTDVDAIRIQPGRDLLTLLTCHPPATGGRQRYLVFCERIYP